MSKKWFGRKHDIILFMQWHKERVGCPAPPKPLALLELIIKASSRKGNVVLGPFCGFAAISIATERLGREWIGMDISYKAYELVKNRLDREVKKDVHMERESSLILFQKKYFFKQVHHNEQI